MLNCLRFGWLGWLGEILGKLAKILGFTLDIWDILQLIFPSAGATSMTAFTEYIPWWEIILLVILTFIVLLVIQALITRKLSYKRQLMKYPKILKKLDSRNTHLAYYQIKHGVDENKVKALVQQLGGLLKFSPRILSESRLNKRQINYIEKKLRQHTKKENILDEVSMLMDANDLGLKELQKNDFVFRFYSEQLKNMPIPPNLAIYDEIEYCLSYSYRFNNLLILNKTYLKEIMASLPVKYWLANVEYSNIAKSRTLRAITRVNEIIQEFINEQSKRN